jgi:hypothetical protein
VTKDSKGTLRVLHGANEVATIRSIIHGGGVKVAADGREWRLRETDNGWVATGPDGRTTAELSTGPLGGRRLRVGDFEAKVSKTEVKGLLTLKLQKEQAKRVLQGEVLATPPTSDPHAVIALAAAALTLDKDLEPRPDVPSPNGDNISAALRYGMHH